MIRKGIGKSPKGAGPQGLAGNQGIKEVFYPLLRVANAGTLALYGMHSVGSLANTQRGYVEFYVPMDFSRIIDLELVLISAFSSAGADIDIAGQFGALGESYLLHQVSDTASTYALTNDVISEIDLSTLFTAIWRGDYVGVRVINSDAAGSIHVLGIRLRYI